MRNKSTDELAGALKLLEAAACHKREELKSVLSGKYANLRGLIQEGEKGFLRTLLNAKDTAMEAAGDFEEASMQKARELGRDADRNVRQNPWAYLAGTAVVGILLGCTWGRNSRR